MVSFTLDAVKFLLIYRHLQNTYWFKRGNLPVCSSHNLRLWHCPVHQRRATLKPTPICIWTPDGSLQYGLSRQAAWIHTRHRASTVALLLMNLETARFQIVKNKALHSKRLSINVCHHSSTPSRASACMTLQK